MNNKRTALAGLLATALIMAALTAIGFGPIANNALAQITNSAAANSTSTNSTTPSTSANIVLTPTTGQAGSVVTVTGTGFTASTAVSLKFDSISVSTSPASIIANSAGSFTATFTVPSNTTGTTSHTVTANDSIKTATAIFTSSSTTTSTTTATTSTPSTSVGSTVVQQGTIATASGSSNSTILMPRSDGAVFTGTISFAAGAPVELYVLHAYGITSGQTVNGSLTQPKTVIGSDGKTYAVSVLNNAGSSAGDSGSTVFSGNGLMLHSTGGTGFIATYTLKASVDTPTIVNNVGQTTTSTATSTTSTTTSSNATSSVNSTATSSSNSSSSATISATAGSSNDTIIVNGHGFTPNAQVTMVASLSGSTSGPTSSFTADSAGTFSIAVPLVSTTHGASIAIKATSSNGGTASTTYTVP